MPGTPAVGPLAIMLRRGVVPSVRRRGMSGTAVSQTGPLQRWGSLTGPTFLYTAANWPSVSWYLEAYMRATSAKALAQLYDVTAAAAVANSTVTEDNATDGLMLASRQRSTALTLVDGHEYQMQFGVQDGGGGGVLGARLIAIATPAITYTFVDAKADGADATVVRPIDWNAVHTGEVLEAHVPLIALAAEMTI